MKNRLVLCLVALTVAAPETAAAATRRLAIVLGNNAGGPLDKPLHYAEEDAGKMADVLAQIGDVRSSDLFVLVSGLRGAADVSGDGRITLAEAYRYAFDHTVADTASIGSRQHPGYNYRMAGQGELVLTEVTQPSASLELPEGFERALVILIRRDQVLAEVSAETARRLALAPGECVLRVWKGSRAYAARFALAAGQSRKVVWSDLAEVPSPSVASKGELEPDLEGLSPEARLEYEQRYLSVRDTVTVSEGKSQSSYELGRGKYRNPITEEEFLRVVGRSADADFYQRRKGLRMKLGIGGLAIGLVGGAVGLIMSICDRSLDDPRFGPDCVKDYRGAYVLGASGFVGVGLLWSALFINPHPFDSTRATAAGRRIQPLAPPAPERRLRPRPRTPAPLDYGPTVRRRTRRRPPPRRGLLGQGLSGGSHRRSARASRADRTDLPGRCGEATALILLNLAACLAGRSTHPLERRLQLPQLGGKSIVGQSSKGPVVLVVDDDIDIRDVLRGVLEDEGYVVAEAANGEQALSYLEQLERPAAILLDLFMPVMDGWEVIRRLESLPDFAVVPVLVVTATGPHWGYPGNRVFRKPLNLRELVTAVNEVAAPATEATP